MVYYLGKGNICQNTNCFDEQYNTPPLCPRLRSMQLNNHNHLKFIDKYWKGDLDAFVSFYIRLEKNIKSRSVDTEDNMAAIVKSMIQDFTLEYSSLINERNETTLKDQEALLVKSNSSLKEEITYRVSIIDEKIGKIENQLSRTTDGGSLEEIKQNLVKIKESLVKETTSSLLGKKGEQKMEEILNEILPSHEIINSSGKCANGDFIVRRDESPDILIEVKNWTTKVGIKDVDKFERDCLFQKSHGVFISLNSGIANRNNFEIRVLDNKYITFYLSHNDYDQDAILAVINYIYQINTLFVQSRASDDLVVNETELKTIQGDLLEFQKDITSAKNHIKKSLDILTKINLQNLKDKFTVVAERKVA